VLIVLLKRDVVCVDASVLTLYIMLNETRGKDDKRNKERGRFDLGFDPVLIVRINNR